MIENNYFNYKNYSLSSKTNGQTLKVRLWERNTNENENIMQLVETKNYDYKTGYITKNANGKYAKFPMTNGINKNKTSVFIVEDNGLSIAGTMKNGDVTSINKLEKFPQTEKEFSSLGSTAKRFCKKIITFVQSNTEKVSPITETIKNSKITILK